VRGIDQSIPSPGMARLTSNMPLKRSRDNL